jgi:hypothetical protein
VFSLSGTSSGKEGWTNQWIVLNLILVFVMNVKIHDGVMLDLPKGEAASRRGAWDGTMTFTTWDFICTDSIA